jgi:hypothetical protein
MSTVPHDSEDSALSVHRRPTSTRPRPGLDQPMIKTRMQGLRDTGPEIFSPSHPLCHHGVQGWPAILEARRYSNLHSVRQNFTSKAPRRPCLLLPYKRAGRGLYKGLAENGQKKTSHLPTVEDQHLKQSPLYFHFLFETWDRFPLS